MEGEKVSRHSGMRGVLSLAAPNAGEVIIIRNPIDIAAMNHRDDEKNWEQKRSTKEEH